MRGPTYSIIVPVYNAENTLNKCIRSILSQTYQNFELLLINDGSRDRSKEICEEYAKIDDRVIVYNKINGGVSSARNIGLKYAKGSWITFCDADDWVAENWLDNFICNIKGADMVCQGMNCDYSMWCADEHKNHTLGFSFRGSAGDLLENLFANRMIGYVYLKCFKTEIIQANHIRFDERFNCYEDEEFVLRYLLYVKNAHTCVSPGYNYMCPDFDQKYLIKRNLLDLYASMFNSAKVLYANYKSAVLYHYLESYTMCLLESFAINPDIDRLRKYRGEVGKLVLETKMFFLTRLLIWVDISCLFSYFMLRVHSKLKVVFRGISR